MSRRKNATTKKKANNVRTASRVVSAAWAAARRGSEGGRRWLCVVLLFQASVVQAQYRPQCMSLNNGEEVTYEVFFKWGILMSRAGEGKLSFRPSTYQGRNASRYRLTFRTTKFFDSVYKMRDTIDCYYAPDYALMYSSKHTNEGGYCLTDEITFSYPDRDRTHVHTLQYTPERVKTDTVLTMSSGYVFDMLGAVFFLRTLDWK
ncbi:MAG: DUF3108 domain-containing protein, partial [Tannerella sp.]|nr:DUF3108 domain-containing protein [Tannerella sp.]